MAISSDIRWMKEWGIWVCLGKEVGTVKCVQGKGGLESGGKRGGFLRSIPGGLAVVWRGRAPHPPTTVAQKGSVLGWVLCPPKRYVGFLTPRSSECDLIWK